MALSRQAARTDSPEHNASMNNRSCSEVKHRCNSVLLNHNPGAQLQPRPRGLSGSQNTRHPRMPYSVGETAPRMYPCRTNVPTPPHRGHTCMGSRLKNCASSPLSLKKRCIRCSIPIGRPEPSHDPGGTHSNRPMTASGRAALRHSSQVEAVPPASSLPPAPRRHYGATGVTNTSVDLSHHL